MRGLRFGFAGLALFAIAVDGSAAEARPNILFCIADDASYPHMGAYGCRWVKTPAFDRVAKEGLLFTKCYTPNAKCAPSRACILTGRNPWQLKEACNHWCYFPAEFKTYCEALAEHDYFVGKTAKGWGPGVAKDAEGKPRALAGKGFDARKTETSPTTGIPPVDYAANFDDFLDAAPKGRPWCFWYGGLEPHRKYEYRSGIEKGGKRLEDIDRVPDYWPDNETVRTDMLDYAFEIEHFDRHLGRMLDSLERRGLLDNTLVVVTSDNGMPFPRAKGQQYEISGHMPLAMMWKQGIVKPGRTIDDYVSFIDFAPTFVELAGLKWSDTGMAAATGRSLTGLFASDKAGRVEASRDHVLVGQERHDVGRPHDVGYPIRGIVKDGWMYLENFEPSRWPMCNPETGYLNTDGSPTKTVVLQTRSDEARKRFWKMSFGRRPSKELYHLADDADCVKNLAEMPEQAARLAALREQLIKELKAQEDPRMFGKGSVFDEYPFADKSSIHFYERFMKGEKVNSGWVNKSDFEEAPIEE